MYIGIYVITDSFPNAFLRHESICTDSFRYHDEKWSQTQFMKKNTHEYTHDPLPEARIYVFANSKDIQSNDYGKYRDELRRQKFRASVSYWKYIRSNLILN